MDLKKLSVGIKKMNNQEEINFNQLNLPTEKEAERLKRNFGDDLDMNNFIDKYTDKIIIGDEVYKRTPDPDRARRLIPRDKPIVLYCKTRYYLINSAKLQMVDQLTCIVGIRRKIGKQLLLTSQNKEAEE